MLFLLKNGRFLDARYIENEKRFSVLGHPEGQGIIGSGKWEEFVFRDLIRNLYRIIEKGKAKRQEHQDTLRKRSEAMKKIVEILEGCE